ncbi:MAG: hypothetical protein M1818_001542 [Claussenomyces sp. TS43310]|nr:MAG: hypothetical protein M1818_001542 [Claussenomyces sp. TS43310]
MVAITLRNEVLQDNPPTGAEDYLTTNGSDWLWAVTSIYLLATLLVVGLSYFARAGEKIFHYLFTISLLTGSVAYFTMAANLGWVPIKPADTLSSPGAREIFYARYINWFIGWTPIVIAASLLSCVSWATIAYNVALTWTVATAWLASSVVSNNWKWSYYAFGLFAALLLFLSLINPGLPIAKRAGVHRHYVGIVGWLCLMFVLYAIAHGLDEGNRIGVTETFIFISIVDLFTVPCLSCLMLLLSQSWDYRELHLQFTQYGRVGQTSWSPEKPEPAVNDIESPAGPSAPAPFGTAPGAAANKETV